MGLVLKHVERTKSGGFQYRRRVPKEVLGIIAKREFKRRLGDTEKEALAAYPRYHAQVQLEIAKAKRRRTGSEHAARPDASDREAYAEALQRRADLVARGVTDDELSLVADAMADSYLQDEWEPVGVPPVERHTINVLRVGPDRYKAPEATLDDALRLYRKEHLRENDPAADSRAVALANRVIAAVIKTLGRDAVLTSLTREEARKVRDEMLDRVKKTGRGVGDKVSPATVSRELSIVSAVVNFGKTEFGLPETFANPFNNLRVPTNDAGVKASDKRDPLPPKVLKAVRARVLSRADAKLALIWRLIEGTGCRIAEVTGLRVEDVEVVGNLPHIRIEPHELRRLKTDSSRRIVPLVGDALEAAEEALEFARGGAMLFPSYGRPRGSDAASAALMKHVRAVTPDSKHVVHSLRHNMKDALILAEVPSLDQNLILGHVLSDVGDRTYGGKPARLRKTTWAMKRALGIPLTAADVQLTSEEESY
mgnify:CR=1 FL=1